MRSILIWDYFDATYFNGRLHGNMRLTSRSVVPDFGINALGFREVPGIAVLDSHDERL